MTPFDYTCQIINYDNYEQAYHCICRLKWIFLKLLELLMKIYQVLKYMGRNVQIKCLFDPSVFVDFSIALEAI